MKDKILTIILQGGLGNQLFQFANAFVLSRKNNMKLRINIRGYSNSNDRQFELNKFPNLKKVIFFHNQYFIDLTFKILNKFFIFYRFFKNKKFEYSPYVFNKELFNYKFKKNTNLIGYFQSEKYFMHKRKEILQLFRFPKNKNKLVKFFKQKIKHCDSIALHLRGGDYINNPIAKNFHGNLTKNYYLKSIQYISKKIYNPHFFIFTDDINFFNKITFIKNFNHTLVDINSPVDSLYLMSLCKYHIIANSSFSWWGAWLCTNKNKIVCAPKKWVKAKIKKNDIIPATWIKI
jgi:hypothetical protein